MAAASSIRSMPRASPSSSRKDRGASSLRLSYDASRPEPPVRDGQKKLPQALPEHAPGASPGTRKEGPLSRRKAGDQQMARVLLSGRVGTSSRLRCAAHSNSNSRTTPTDEFPDPASASAATAHRH